MKRTLTAAVFATAAIAPSSLSANTGLPMGAAQCAARAEMVQALGERFQEASTATGVVNPNVVLEIFVSESGTWTILATGTDGQSCVLSAGEGWDSKELLAGLPGA